MRKYWISVIAAAVTASMAVSGCGAKQEAVTTTAAPTENETAAAESTENETAATEAAGQADRANIEKLLHMVTAYTRASGTDGETKAAKEIQSCLQQLGYETSLQTFDQKTLDDQPDITGTNVIAVRKADSNPEQADILYITAHHDAKPGIQGAEDDASGVTVLLETARLLSQLPTDTEIRFVTFSGEENGRIGSRYHVEQLSEEERSRVIGDIQLDDLGYKGSEYLELSTVDGKPTMLGDMLSEQAQQTPDAGKALPYKKEGMSDHNSFHTYGMPSVMLGQDAFAFENHSMQDRVEIIDAGKLQQAAQLAADVAAKIMSEETASLREKAYEDQRTTIAYEVQEDTVIQFDMDRNYVENMMGLSGTLEEESTNEFQDKNEVWKYPIIWFGMEEPVETLFHYRNNYLELAEIPANDVIGADIETARIFLEQYLGEANANEMDQGKAYSWEDAKYHKFISLEPADGTAYNLLIMGYNEGRDFMTTYDLEQGFDQLKPETETDKKLLELVRGIVYPDDLAIVEFQIYTDGMNASTGLTGGLSAEDNTRMDYSLDSVDAFDENGEYRNYNKTLRTAVHEYGHVVTLNSRQVDITKQDETMPSIMFEQETYAEDSYMRAYYEQFWKDGDVKSGNERYRTNPDEFVSEYAANNASEDIAESFMQFVLSSCPTDDSIASQKIRFFYDYEDMVARRNYIRENFGIDETNEVEGNVAEKLPELKAGDYRVELEGNPTTGYRWHYTIEPEGIVEEAASEYYQNPGTEGNSGAGGVFVFDFSGVKAGEAEAAFQYDRPWETAEPIDEVTYRLTIDAAGNVAGEKLP